MDIGMWTFDNLNKVLMQMITNSLLIHAWFLKKIKPLEKRIHWIHCIKCPKIYQNQEKEQNRIGITIFPSTKISDNKENKMSVSKAKVKSVESEEISTSSFI